MSIKINYLKKTTYSSKSNLVLFTNEKVNISNLKKFISDVEFSYINDLLKTEDTKKNIFVYVLNSKRKIVLISIKNKLKRYKQVLIEN